MDSYVGKRLDGRYEIREIIGVGGMAVVYKAYDNIDDRIVAIKILKEEYLANEEFRRRFKNESKAIAVLSHPNIVKVYDVSFGDRLQYIVMEYIEGITLKEYIEQQKVINWKEAVHFTTQILRALQHAHDKGIVHRDVKPQNIMLLQNGNIKVTDFGIARFSRGETRTMTESAIGSVHYISPEQARGEITDDKADIYSVGVVLYEMITGKLPFESDSAVSVAIMQLQNEAVHPRDINPQIPVGLEQITLRAMQKNTKDRYQSAAEMLLDLDEFKRNPSVKFDYSYFVDKEPTQYITQQEASRIAAAPVAKTHIQPVQIEEEDEDDDDTVPNKTLPILVGVASALLAVIVLIIIFLALFTDIFKNDKLEVPDLLGKDYAAEIVGNKKYAEWEITPTYVTSTDSKYSAGQICKQSPYGGSKAKKGTEIKVEVIANGTQVEIPEIVGLELGTAKQALVAAGFVYVNTIPEYTDDCKEGLVISSEPAQGTKADTTTTTVIIKVAAPAVDNPDLKEVPSVVGLNYTKDKEDVTEYFTSLNLVVGTVKEEDSKEPAGTVIQQSIDAGEKVPEKTKIDLVISSGKIPESSGEISFKLPKTNKSMKLEVFVSNELQSEYSKTLNCDGSTYKFKITGSGEKKNITCKLDGETIYTCTADFSKDPTVISNGTQYDIKVETQELIPNVVGMTYKEAVATLNDAGFTNISASMSNDDVIAKMDPAPSSFIKYKTSQKITLIAKEKTTEKETNTQSDDDSKKDSGKKNG